MGYTPPIVNGLYPTMSLTAQNEMVPMKVCYRLFIDKILMIIYIYGAKVKRVTVWPVSGAAISATHRECVWMLSDIGILLYILPDHIDQLPLWSFPICHPNQSDNTEQDVAVIINSVTQTQNYIA